MQNDYQNYNQTPYTKNQKIAITILSVFGVFIIIMWVVQFKNNISAPFAYKESEEQSDTAADNATNKDLTNKDTDEDGLSDYDELNVYKTSPYLPDSDGDGFSDNEEIKNDKDPNCPSGKTCSTVSTSSEDLANPESDKTASSDQEQSASSLTTTASSTGVTALDPVFKNLDAGSLRQLLIDSGMQKEMLDKFSDEDLMKTYQNTLKNQ